VVEERKDFADFRREMEGYWQDADEQAQSFKDPTIPEKRLLLLFERFDARERVLADQVVSEWVLSDNEAMQFDALIVVDKLKIRTALPALKELVARLGSRQDPGTPWKIEKVTRIIRSLN